VEQAKLSRKGLTICIVAGVLISTVGPIVGKALSASRPLSPYGVTLLFTLGAFLSTFPILHLLVRHPLGGTPAPSIGYWVGTPLQHFAGVAAGSVWTLGTALTWVAANLVGIALAMAIGQAKSSDCCRLGSVRVAGIPGSTAEKPGSAGNHVRTLSGRPRISCIECATGLSF
jgi:hypothetical protein